MNTPAGKILVVDDDEDILKTARLFLKRQVERVVTEKNPESIPSILANEQFDVILLDLNFTKDVSSGHEGFYWLDKILAIDPSAVVVLITAYGDVEMAVRAIKEGAADFVVKPWNNEKFLATIMSAVRLRHTKMQVDTLKSQQKILSSDLDQTFQDIIGKSYPMLKIFDTIQRVAETDADILITGENGTGKELIARAIHRKSKRANEVFVSVDLGAITETLFESELFGHTKGSFTDAKEDRAGRFEVASGGTIFLDEIGNLSLPLQAKLLTVLQSRQVTRVGSNKPKPVNIRLICATNMSLQEMIKKNEFRQDLLYRINTIEIRLPALRERQEDIPLLAEHYFRLFTKKYNRNLRGISDEAMNKMMFYGWPGNVRELQHTMERTIIMCTKDVIKPEDIVLYEQNNNNEPADNLHIGNYNLDEVEKTVIRKVMRRFNGNISLAAKELGLTRTSLYRRLEKYGL